MAVIWNADFDISPKGSDAVGQMDDKIRETRQAVRERVEQEHLFDKNTSTQQGLHKMGSARVWLSDTEPDSPIPTAILTETAGDESKGRLWIVTAAGVPTGEVKVYDGTDWVSMPGSTAASILTLLKTVDGTGSGLDADLWDGKELADLALSDVDDDATYAKTDVAGAGAANDIGDATGASTAAKLLTLVKTVDGAGSGLDADTIDGIHASSITTTIDSGSAVHAGSSVKIKTLSVSITTGNNVALVNHGIASAQTNKSIIGIHWVIDKLSGSFRPVDVSTVSNWNITNLSYSDTQVAIGIATNATETLTYYLIVFYV